MLKSRIITASILAPLALLFVFFLPETGFVLVTTFVVLMAAWEWSSIMRLAHFSQRLAYLLLVLFFILLTSNYLSNYVEELLMLASAWWLLALVLVVLYPRFTKAWRNLYSQGVIGIIVLLPTWVALVIIQQLESGSWLLCYLFAVVWGADTGAYFAGKRYGKRKLMPRVSPKKTWVGAMGGAATVMLISAIAQPWFVSFAVPWYFFFLAAAIAAVSVIGDLLESMLKRYCGIKDSGSLLPGHGGILDRIDSLTAAAPVFALGLLVLSDIFHGV